MAINTSLDGGKAVQSLLAHQSQVALRVYGSLVEIYEGVLRTVTEHYRSHIDTTAAAIERLSTAGTVQEWQDSLRQYKQASLEALQRLGGEIARLGQQVTTVPALLARSLQEVVAILQRRSPGNGTAALRPGP